MSTIKDVSKFSGLSLATISKYLNGGNVRDENRRSIDQAVEALGYRVNRNARSLKTNRTMTVGVVMPTLSVPFFGSVISSLDQTLREAGYTSFVCSYDFDRDLELEKLRVLCNNNVDGIVLAAQHVSAKDLEEIRNARGTEMPMVLVDRKVEQLESDLVGLDNPAAVEMAIAHLQERGYRDVLMVTEPFDGTSSRIERVSSFKTQIGQRPALTGAVVETGSELTAQLKTFLTTPGPGHKALFCANGIAALAATHALRELQCNLFEDVGLIALDDLDWYPLVGSGITALAQPTAEIGASAFECLLKRLRGDDGPVRTMDFSARLIVRGSTLGNLQ